jgi:hypothetical protein
MTLTTCNQLADHATDGSKTKLSLESLGATKNGFEFFLAARFHPCLQLVFTKMS